MEFASVGSGDHSEHNGVSLVKMYDIYAAQGDYINDIVDKYWYVFWSNR